MKYIIAVLLTQSILAQATQLKSVDSNPLDSIAVAGDPLTCENVMEQLDFWRTELNRFNQSVIQHQYDVGTVIRSWYSTLRQYEGMTVRIEHGTFDSMGTSATNVTEAAQTMSYTYNDCNEQLIKIIAKLRECFQK